MIGKGWGPNHGGGGHSIVELKTMCETSLLPILYGIDNF